MTETPKTYDVIGFTSDGKLHPPDAETTVPFDELYALSGAHRGAVARETEGKKYHVFDLNTATFPPEPPTPRAGWRKAFVSRAKAIAHAVWFLR